MADDDSGKKIDEELEEFGTQQITKNVYGMSSSPSEHIPPKSEQAKSLEREKEPEELEESEEA